MLVGMEDDDCFWMGQVSLLDIDVREPGIGS